MQTFIRFAGAVIGLVSLMGQPVFAQEQAGKENQPIHITSEQLIADNIQKYAEFIGNVKAVQGGTTITSERLKIFYDASARQGADTEQESDPAPPPSAEIAPGGQEIQKIVATGKVIIEFDEMVARSAEAVYTTSDRVLVLTGAGSTITKPDSGTISGSKITVHRDSGKIRFDGNVQGIFKAGERGLN